jgi:alpha-L-fucosidase 2
VLPALPNRWPAGHVAGLVARGGFVVGINWSDGHVDRVAIHSRLGQVCRLKVDRVGRKISLVQRGPPVPFRALRDGAIEFPTSAGKHYEFKEQGR